MSKTSPQTVAWFGPLSGIAGDMALGALLDAGADLAYVRSQVETLGVGGWSLTCERVLRNEMAATRAVVETAETHHHRRWRDIRELLERSELAPRVKQRAQAAFEALAVAEGEVHGIAAEEVHFHEVGALDAIVDIVGVAAALESLDIETTYCGTVAVGTGTVTAAHGVLPNPPPAVVRLLRGRPLEGLDIGVELTTPTGAAIVAGLTEPSVALPKMAITAVGFGAGTRDLPDRPNVTQVIVGTAAQKESGSFAGSELANAMAAMEGAAVTTELTELAANLDDISGEVLGHSIEELIAQGALDAWAVPIVMKKGRPAHTLTVLCEPAEVTRLADVTARLTGTLGLRARPVTRTALERRVSHVEVEGHRVAIKHGPHRAKPEWSDVVEAAAALGRTPAEVARAASALADQADPLEICAAHS